MATSIRRPRDRIFHKKNVRRVGRTKSQKKIDSFLKENSFYIPEKIQKLIFDHSRIPGFIERSFLPITADEFLNNMYSDINQKLREGKRNKLSKSEKQIFHSLCQLMRGLSFPLKVYRRINLSIEEKDGFIPIKSFFLFSTSLDIVSNSFSSSTGNALIELTLPKETKAIVTNAEEAEVILPPDKYIIKIIDRRTHVISMKISGHRIDVKPSVFHYPVLLIKGELKKA